MRGETNEETNIDTLVATTFFISPEATTGARASAHPGAARDAPDRTELQAGSSEKLIRQVTRSNRPHVRTSQLRSPSSERERSCGTSSRDLSVRVRRVPRKAEKVFFVVVECASRGTRRTKEPGKLRGQVTGSRRSRRRMSYRSCAVRHSAAVGNDPVTCGFESGASLATGKRVFRRHRARVATSRGTRRTKEPPFDVFRSQEQIIPAS